MLQFVRLQRIHVHPFQHILRQLVQMLESIYPKEEVEHRAVVRGFLKLPLDEPKPFILQVADRLLRSLLCSTHRCPLNEDEDSTLDGGPLEQGFMLVAYLNGSANNWLLREAWKPTSPTICCIVWHFEKIDELLFAGNRPIEKLLTNLIG